MSAPTDKEEGKRGDWIFAVVFAAIFAFQFLNVVDVVLYCRIVDRFGAQWKPWPGSGFYLTLNPPRTPERE